VSNGRITVKEGRSKSGLGKLLSQNLPEVLEKTTGNLITTAGLQTWSETRDFPNTKQ
jgi:hypothetical protein